MSLKNYNLISQTEPSVEEARWKLNDSNNSSLNQ